MSGFAKSGHELICENVANGHFRTHAPQQAASPLAKQNGTGIIDAKRLGRLEIDHRRALMPKTK
jgi:hypothetical protein